MDEQIDMVFKSVDEFENELKPDSNMGNIAEYNQENRRRFFDNVSKRKKYDDQIYGERKSVEDYVTGSTLHKNSKMAARKYKGKKTYHVSQIDHIVSLKRIHDKASNNPYLTNEDIKAVGNRLWNYRQTQAHLNMSKGEKSNFAVAGEKIIAGEYKAAGKLALDGIKSETLINAELTGRTVINAGKIGLEEVRGAQMYLGIEAARNIYLVCNGKMDKTEAVKNMTVMTTNIAKNGILEHSARFAVAKIQNESKNELLRMAAKSGGSIFTKTAVIIVGAVTTSLLSGDSISMEQIFSDLVNNTVGSVSGILTTAAMLVPPPLNAAVGASLLVASIGSTVYTIANQSQNALDDKKRKIGKVESRALQEIEYQRSVLESIIKSTYKEWDDKIDAAFEKILQGTLDNNVNIISEGLDSALSIIGKSVRFKSSQEFDDFFMNENSKFVF